MCVCEKMAPAPGFEPGTKWLTATYSTAELCWNDVKKEMSIAMLISTKLLFNIIRWKMIPWDTTTLTIRNIVLQYKFPR